MRVIAGAQKGRRLLPPKGQGLRPTSGRVKEALFSILHDKTTDARFLDLFAGTGAIGIEALSRGAQSVMFVEANPSSLKVLQANLGHCGLTASATILSCTAEVFLRQPHAADEPFDIVFADPPYHEDAVARLLPALDRSNILASDCIVILEHFNKVPVPASVGRLVLKRQYRYGDTNLSVYNVQGERELAS